MQRSQRQKKRKGGQEYRELKKCIGFKDYKESKDLND